MRTTLRDRLIELEQTREAVMITTANGSAAAGTITEVGIDFVEVDQVGPDGKDVDVVTALFYVVSVIPLGTQAPPAPVQPSGLVVPS